MVVGCGGLVVVGAGVVVGGRVVGGAGVVTGGLVVGGAGGVVEPSSMAMTMPSGEPMPVQGSGPGPAS